MIVNLAKKFLGHELINGASLIFIGSLLISLLNFLFNLFMARNLAVSDYGVLISLISLVTLSTLPVNAVVPMVVAFAASYFAKNELDMVRGLFFKINRLTVLSGFTVFIIFILFTQIIGQFLNISNDALIILAGLNVFLGFVAVLNIPLLQAKLAFTYITFTNLLSGFLKLIGGISTVFLGFTVGGVLWAVFFSSLIQYLLNFFPLKFIFQKGISLPKVSSKKLFNYGIPAALATFSLMSLVNTDIILVKHFFNPTEAGIYAGLSVVGRVIFFFSAPLGTVMFPLVTQKYARAENYHHIFGLALLLVAVTSIALTGFYFIFPEFTIRFFIKNEEYLAVTSLLGPFGIFIAFYSLVSLFTYFFLSTKKTEIFIPMTIAALTQAALIWLYHETFFQIIVISLSVVGLLLILLLLYYWKLYAKNISHHPGL